jgi:hypothetical protein
MIFRGEELAVGSDMFLVGFVQSVVYEKVQSCHQRFMGANPCRPKPGKIMPINLHMALVSQLQSALLI